MFFLSCELSRSGNIFLFECMFCELPGELWVPWMSVTITQDEPSGITAVFAGDTDWHWHWGDWLKCNMCISVHISTNYSPLSPWLSFLPRKQVTQIRSSAWGKEEGGGWVIYSVSLTSYSLFLKPCGLLELTDHRFLLNFWLLIVLQSSPLSLFQHQELGEGNCLHQPKSSG